MASDAGIFLIHSGVKTSKYSVVIMLEPSQYYHRYKSTKS